MRGDRVVLGAFGRELDKEDALMLAAWIIVLADDSNDFTYTDDIIDELIENNED